eukprot:Gb_18010 [translate_table: standard]
MPSNELKIAKKQPLSNREVEMLLMEDNLSCSQSSTSRIKREIQYKIEAEKSLMPIDKFLSIVNWLIPGPFGSTIVLTKKFGSQIVPMIFQRIMRLIIDIKSLKKLNKRRDKGILMLFTS